MFSIRASLAAVLATALLAPVSALGRGWQGVTPGSTTEPEVTAKFGAPSTQGKLSGRLALVYKDEQAIAGTRQAQFFESKDGVVVEVVVFPTNQLDRETVEGTYGHPNQKAFTDDFRTVWLFKASGVTVFFGKDGYVDAISFKAPDLRQDPARPRTALPATAARVEN
ncbi:MAG TPA: hypothetical protein VMK12_14875 [Anaeromyxobacteraceae bacterium]|nr:hypothetical protein [Anaeromyxobacteraceae bacterium]